MTCSDTDAAPGANLRVRTEGKNLQMTRITNIVLSAAGAICVLVVFYSAYHFAGEDLISPDRLVIFFVFPGLSAALLFAALRLQPYYKVGLSLLFFTAAFSIYMLEAFLRLSSFSVPAEWFTYKSPEERRAIAKNFGVDFDTRTKVEVITDLGKAGIHAHPYASASMLLQKQADGTVRSAIAIGGAEVVPLGGISNAVTILCNETGAYVIYKSDEYGFNNPEGIWGGQVGITAVGDSFTHGSCVPPDKNFVGLIRRHYRATLNLGGGGQGPLLMLATLKEYVQYVRPALVLWFYFEGNDLENLKTEKANLVLPRYLKSDFSQNLRTRQSDIDRALMAYIETAGEQMAREQENTHEVPTKLSSVRESVYETIRLTRLRRTLQAMYTKYSAYYVSDDAKALLDLFRDILLDAKVSVDGWGGKLYFVYLPQWERYGKPALASKDRETVLSLARNVGIPVIDIHEAFQAQDDPLGLFPFRQDAHYNEEGNRLVAKQVLQTITLNEP